MAGKSERKSWPRESRSRREGWTEGPAVVLAGGGRWHLPRVDASLIPWLGKLSDDAWAVEQHLDAAARGEVYGDGLSAESWLDVTFINFAANLISMQYRNRRWTVLDLVMQADRTVAWPVLWAYLDDFRGFARPYRLGLRLGLPPLDLN